MSQSRDFQRIPDRLALCARWLFPGDGPPLEYGTVEIDSGRIAAIHTRHDPAAFDLGQVAIVPGMCNTHTHLELSGVSAPLAPPRPFTAWLEAVIANRRARSPRGTGAAGETTAISSWIRGIEECALHGTTLLGNITVPDEAPPESAIPGPRIISFLELLGLSPERIVPQLEQAAAHLKQVGRSAGLSPHAPYSVHPDLFRELVELAIRSHAPVAMHLAETPAELELLRYGTGEFVEFLTRLGVWRSDAIPRDTRPLDYLRELSRLDRALVIHGNYLAEDELDFLTGRKNFSVVYCPRTHAYFGHTPHPWRRLLARGVNVALGTDSRASNPDLSLWNELLFLRGQFADFDPAELLMLGTRAGAQALGLEQETGSLTVGKQADLAVVSLPLARGSGPFEQLFHRDNRIAAVMRGGTWTLPPAG